MLNKFLIPRPLRLGAAANATILATVHEVLANLDRELADSGARHGDSEPRQEVGSDDPDKKVLAELSTHLWRMNKRLVNSETGRPIEETRKIYRHYEACIDALKQAGVEIIDHTGDAFDAGLSIQVLTYQPTADLDRDRVIETVRPTVYLRDERIQMGVVIIGTPMPHGK